MESDKSSRINLPNPVVVWDHSESPPKDQSVILWNGYVEDEGHFSLLNYLDKNSDNLRKAYLSFIYDLGNLRTQSRTLAEKMEIDSGLSHWWTSLLAEKSGIKSKSVLNCLRLLALNDKFSQEIPESVELVSSSKYLAKSLNCLCDNLNIHFKWSKVKSNLAHASMKELWQKLPHILRAPLSFFRYAICYGWPLRKALSTNWFGGKDAVFFFSYFINLGRPSTDNAIFSSRHWEVLPELLIQSGKRLNWGHHLLHNSFLRSKKTLIDQLISFNKDKKKQGYHCFLDSFFSFEIGVKTISIWASNTLRLLSLPQKIENQLAFHKNGWLWPLLSQDYKSSLYGTISIQNILWISLFDRFMSTLPTQSTGLYLCENQGWERILIYYWKKYGHERLIAVPHTTVRYWDLRYYDDPRILEATNNLSQPVADQIAINGHAAWKELENACQPMNKMVPVEALRYLHLGGKNPRQKDKHQTNSNSKNLLILGDIKYNTTSFMLNLLESLFRFFQDGWNLTLKPHPGNPVSTADYPNLDLSITYDPLDQLLQKFQLAVVTVETSAGLEAYLFGLSVIVVLDDHDLNSSPLRGIEGIPFVSTRKELKNSLMQPPTYSSTKNTDDFFWTDPNLPKWRELLGLK